MFVYSWCTVSAASNMRLCFLGYTLSAISALHIYVFLVHSISNFSTTHLCFLGAFYQHFQHYTFMFSWCTVSVISILHIYVFLVHCISNFIVFVFQVTASNPLWLIPYVIYHRCNFLDCSISQYVLKHQHDLKLKYSQSLLHISRNVLIR